MNTDDNDTDAVLAALEATLRRGRERDRLRDDRDVFGRLCAQAVADGDIATAIDWAEEYELTCGKLSLLVHHTATDTGVDTGGEVR